jgi:fatty-acyl-CoA synthase
MTEPETLVDEGACAVQARVLDVVRELARELGGTRTAAAVAPDASLERDVGLGSLELVELQLRLEAAFGRTLDDAILQIDTPAGIARALLQVPGASVAEPGSTSPSAPLPLAPPPGRVRTLHESLWQRAEASPHRPHVFMREEDGREHTITYGQLLTEAAALAGGLREQGIKRGDTVALMLPTGQDFLVTFQGILIAGAIPVPIYPPIRLDRLEEYATRQSAILADAGVRLLVTVGRARALVGILKPRVPTLRGVVTAAELTDIGASWGAPEGKPEDAAFIQYTSGSTGAPKGVLLSHANLLANIQAITLGLEATPADVGASWLPLYHDMGLIGSWLFCMHEGLPIAIQSPLSFLSRPERWLRAISDRRATLSAAPNFAYELCVRRIPEEALAGLDLSSWRCALNGAEPVSPDTLERFAERFAPYGFRREALFPVYGLAENSVAVCFPPVLRGPLVDRIARDAFARDRRAEPAQPGDASAVSFVSVGRAVPGHEVQIADDASAPLPDRHVGRLLFRGPSQTAGYFNKPEATAAIQVEGGWLDSGDLAYQADGEIYVTGRRKDLIIKAGRNLVPQEIEEATARVEGVRKGCVVAFGAGQSDLGTERLVVVAETRLTDPARRERLVGAITEQVAAAVGVPPDDVALVPPGGVPKTSSGKIRRTTTRELYTSGELGRTRGTRLGTKLRLALAAGGEWAVLGGRAVVRGLYAAWVIAVVLGTLLLLWPVAMLMRSPESAHAVARRAARLILALAGVRLSAEGLENVPISGPLLLLSNHTSYADVLALFALLPRHFRVVAKREVLGWPLVGAFVRKLDYVTVERFDVTQSASDAGKLARVVAEGAAVLVFPEGTFTPTAGLRAFRLGAFKTAVETATPVVPLALRGARHVLRDGTFLPRRGAIHVWAGPPLLAEGAGWPAVVSLRDRTGEAIAAHCGEPRLDMAKGSGPRE